MRQRKKSFIAALCILLTFIVISFTVFNTSAPELGNPGDFYETSREVTLNELKNIAEKYYTSVYIPYDLPNKLELTTIYLKDNPFLGILTYSSEGNKDFKTAELTIQISPSGDQPSLIELESIAKNSSDITVLEVNDWSVLVNEKAYAGGDEETREKFGDYILLIFVWIDGMRYMVRCPTLTKNSVLQMVESMDVLTQ